MRAKASGAMVILMGAIGLPATAEVCTSLQPNPPTMTKDGDQLTVEEFNDITDSVTRYDTSLSDYRACLDAAMNDPESEANWRSALDAFNTSATEQMDVYDRYDDVSADFRDSRRQAALAAAEAAQRASAESIQDQVSSMNANN